MTLPRPRLPALLPALLLACCCSGFAQPTAPDPAETQRLRAAFETEWDALAQRYPEFATFRGDPRFDDRWTDNSAEARAQRDRQAREWLATLRGFDRARLSASDAVSLDMARDRAEAEVRMQAFEGWRTMTLGGTRGIHTALPDVLRVNPNRSRAEVEKMLARIAAYPVLLDQELVQLKRGIALGWVTSKPVLQRTLAQIDALLQSPETTAIYEPFQNLGPAIPPAEAQALRAQAAKQIAERAQPALRKLRDFIAGPYMAAAPAEGAYSGYPDGAKVYATLVREQTTTTMTPDEIHALGLELVAVLRAQMEDVMRDSGFTGDFKAFLHYLNTEPKFFYASPEAMLAGYRDIAKRIDPELPRLFAELPRLTYGIRAIPAYLGPGAAEYYTRGTADGRRPGWFNANTEAWKIRPRWTMETLVAHEAVPGHHLQTARALELRDLPSFRRSAFYPAFGEGWALYAETLGPELGLYTDRYSLFGHLQAQIFRAARLVVDTGLHAKGWPRQRAIDYLAEQTGYDVEMVSSEVDRYLSNPAQALAYMIGEQKILSLRDKARQALGNRFDIRQFHMAVLDQGAVPLQVLEQLVDDWIARQKVAP